jgi:hypothetical protein
MRLLLSLISVLVKVEKKRKFRLVAKSKYFNQMSYLGSKPDLETICLGAIHLDQSIKEKEIMESVNQPANS